MGCHCAAHAVVTGRRQPILAAWVGAAAANSWIVGLAGQPVASLPPAVAEPAPSTLSRAELLAEFGLPADVRIIAVAGRLVRAKAIDEAIWGFELVRVLHPSARLVVFGDGPDRPRLERFADLVSEPGCVHFAGYRADFAARLPHVDVYWQLDAPRRIPHALLEAMIARVPVVVSDVPVLGSVVSAGETGLLAGLGRRADVARATDQILSDANLAKRLGDSAAAHVQQHWSIENAVAASAALYRNMAPPVRPAAASR